MGRLERSLLVGAAALAAASCTKPAGQPAEQNIVVDNGVLANAEIEAVPNDESSETANNEMLNGEDNSGVRDLNSSSNTD
ncbi:MAG: hypothetical protein ABIW33_05395 [Sphingomicrobium sp.]